MRELNTEIEINAAAEEVWKILTDLKQFTAWNPFITHAEGEIKEGARLSVHIEPPGGTAMTFKPTVICAAPGRELRWLGRLFLPGIFDGEHSFEMSPAGQGRTHFVQREKFSGLLVPFLWKGLATNTRRGFEAMNTALKERAEAGL